MVSGIITLFVNNTTVGGSTATVSVDSLAARRAPPGVLCVVTLPYLQDGHEPAEFYLRSPSSITAGRAVGNRANRDPAPHLYVPGYTGSTASPVG